MEYYQTKKRCLYERIIDSEVFTYLNDDCSSRVIDLSENFVSMVPYASPGPYVVNILPLFGPESSLTTEGVDCSDFTTTTDELIDECALMLKKSILRLQILLDEPCFNLVVQSAPVKNRARQAAFNSSAFFRWHIRITPRLGEGALGGFELGSGFFSNSHMPEDDAAALRGVNLPEIKK